MRALLKLSGEALSKDGDFIHHEILSSLVKDIKECHDSGAEILLVVGGGNIIRGRKAAHLGIDRATTDYMGMLATVINALYVGNALRKQGMEARVMSAIAMHAVCERFVRERALNHLQQRRVVLLAGGTGNPYFTTDSAAALRAIELECHLLLKATKVDGVYDKDPLTHTDAKRYDTLSYDDALRHNVHVMDATAIALARDNELPLRIFNMTKKGALLQALKGEGIYTTIAS